MTARQADEKVQRGGGEMGGGFKALYKIKKEFQDYELKTGDGRTMAANRGSGHGNI